MKTNTQHTPAAPYKGHLERGPDQIYSGPTIRVDLAGYNGAFHLGYTGTTMAEDPDAYADHVIRWVNAGPDLLAALRQCRRELQLLRDAHGHSWIHEEIEAVEAADDAAGVAIARAEGRENT